MLDAEPKSTDAEPRETAAGTAKPKAAKKPAKAAKPSKAAKGAKPAKAPKAAKPAAEGKGGAALLIVESPAKQRTISRFLTKGYVVRSSYGHVRDLPEKKMGVDEKHDFEPTYVPLPRTKKILPELELLAKKAGEVFLATDHDREGESIAWHLVHILDLPPEKVRRITFHEITPTAIQAALKEPRGIDLHLVHAQQARRVIDRLVGYKLSPLLWRKVRRGLSAGRVQSVAVRLIVERDKEIKAFTSEPYFSLTASLEKAGSASFDARLIQWKGQKVESTRVYDLFSEQYRVNSTCFPDQASIDAVVAELKGAAYKVLTVERKEVRRRPSPPFTTSTLQQAASQRFGFPAEKTMRVAQSLYEGVDLGDGEPVGLITYMRTDSVSVAKAAQDEARVAVKAQFGDAYLPAESPVYQTRSKGAQEAHEAIRPTSVARTPDEARRFLDPDQAKLYDLIWKRFMASQMSDAAYDTLSADIGGGPDAVLRASGRILKFDGFLRAYASSEDDDEAEPEGKEEAARLPDLSQGDALSLAGLLPEEHHTSPPPHYNEASLIRALERHGIGRPSTYAPTIKTVMERGYVKRAPKERKLTPSELGTVVTEKLKEYFPEVVSLTYTAEVEERLDRIAEGQDAWQKVVRAFYDPFMSALGAAAKAMEDTKPIPTDEKCPVCQAPMLLRESRFGKYLSCSTFPKCKGKVRLGEDGQKAVPEATDEVCEVCTKPMVIRMGRRGRFLACSGYPACKNTYSLDAEGKKIPGSRPLPTSRMCEKCGKALWLRLGKRGHFLACSGFPKCRNLKPVGKDEAETLREASLKTEAASKTPSSGS